MKKRKFLKVLLVVALVMGAFPTLSVDTQAAALTSISDLISDSRPSTAANHTITFTTPSGVAADDSTITVTFPAGFGMGSIVEDDIDVDDDGTPLTSDTTCTGSVNLGIGVSGQVITITDCSTGGSAIAAGSVVTIRIGDHATGSGTGTNQITNHATPAVYTVSIGGSMADSGDALIAVIATVTASVTVDETLSVTITGQSSCNLGAEITTTSTTIPFGTTAGNAFIDGCQEIDVSTNASGGYVGTLVQSQLLTSGGDTIAEGSCDGACNDTTFSTWATSTNNGFGYCLEDIGGDTDANATAGQQCNDATPEFKTLVTLGGSPEEIMSNTGAVSAATAQVGFRLSVPGNQAAGTYTNDIIYVFTPTY